MDFSALNAGVIDVLGQDVAYQPRAAVALTVRGVFGDSAEANSHPDGVNAWLFIRVADFGDAPPIRGDQVTVGAGQYRVYDVIPDTSGAARLELSEIVLP